MKLPSDCFTAVLYLEILQLPLRPCSMPRVAGIGLNNLHTFTSAHKAKSVNCLGHQLLRGSNIGNFYSHERR